MSTHDTIGAILVGIPLGIAAIMIVAYIIAAFVWPDSGDSDS